jgi:thiosulfate/3-mercaptopyruvate sulfurtransferase
MSAKVLISPTELSELMKSGPVVLIDTRDPGQFTEGHIPGAVNVREVFTYLATSSSGGLGALREKFAEAFGKAGLSGAETAVVYEQSMESGFGQSCRGYILLRYLGYPKIRVLHGGFAAWRGGYADLGRCLPACGKAIPHPPRRGTGPGRSGSHEGGGRRQERR